MRETQADVVEHNYAKVPLTKAAVERILKTAGSVEAVLNKRNKIAKEKGWHEKPPSKKEFVAAVLQEPNLLRRPVLLKGRQIAIGKDEKAIWKLLG